MLGEGKAIVNLKELVFKRLSNCRKSKLIALLIIVVLISITLATVTLTRKTITINIDDKKQTFITYKGTVQDVLDEKGIKIGEKDGIEPSLNAKIKKNTTITLKKAIPIKFICGDSSVQVYTANETVKDALESEADVLQDNGISFDEALDEVSPNLNSKIEKDSTIQIFKVEKQYKKQMETISYETAIEKDVKLMAGSIEVKTKGQNGQKEVTYEIVYKNGVETNRKITSTKIISEPITQVILQGTGTILTASRGDEVAKKCITCSATAYSGHSLTSSGRKTLRDPSRVSTIAVDPTVIPIGSKVYIDGYGYAIAADTGGDIKGNKIDLYFDSEEECVYWGRRQVQVKIIAYPGE